MSETFTRFLLATPPRLELHDDRDLVFGPHGTRCPPGGCSSIHMADVESSPVPTIDPYIACAKRPPAHLEHLFDYLNSTIDRFVDTVVHCLPARRHRRKHLGRAPQPRVFFSSRLGWFNFNMLWFNKRRFSKWRLPWWCVHHHSPSPPPVLALSAITAGVTKAHSTASAKRTSRAIFDSDSFNILVDGGATASISNIIADFVFATEGIFGSCQRLQWCHQLHTGRCSQMDNPR
jgi:hypothetical protein